MTNVESLNAVAEAVANTQRELALFDSLTRAAVTAGKTVETLSAEIANIHTNQDGLDSKARISRLTSTTSAHALAQSDLKASETAIAVVLARCIAAGRVARSAAAEVMAALTTARRANAKAAIEELLDITQIGPLAVGLENIARPVIALNDLEYYFGHSENEPTRQLHSLRSLRERFDELRALCEAEAGLVIPRVTVAQPVPVAEPKPRAAGNVLGTLVAAAA